MKLVRLLIVCLWINGFFFVSSALAGGSGGVCEKPNLLVVLDYSGSMNQNDKWGQAVNAVNQLGLAFERTMRLGLMLFPRGDECRVKHREAVLSACLPDNANSIREQLSRVGSPPRGNNTPIAKGINEASTYFSELQDVGRRSIIVLVTDGRETCRGNPIAAAERAFNNDYPVYVIGFGQGVDGNTLNEIARVGGTDRAYLVNDGPALFDALDQIADRAQVELCDALDNDCDGRIDEGLGDQPCETTCGQGVQQCVNGRYSICQGGDIPEENCNGIDDDCDGEIDENIRIPCVTVSGQPGFQECVNGILEDNCTPEDPNREEVCDGIDNDQDGQVDEVPEEPCQIECNDGRRLCIQGAYICTAEPVTDESCNGFDDDCDGQIDEGDLCSGEMVCAEDGLCLSPCTAGECADPFFCDVDGLCHPEPCNPECTDEQRCRNQQCLDVCQITSDCGANFLCRNRLCIPNDGQTPSSMSPSANDPTPMAPAADMQQNGQASTNNPNQTGTMDAASQAGMGQTVISVPGPQVDTAGGASGTNAADVGGGDVGGCRCDLSRNDSPQPVSLAWLLIMVGWSVSRRRKT